MTALYPNDEPDVTSGITDDAPMETTSPFALEFAATPLLKATSEHEERPAPAHRSRVHRVHHVQGEARDVHGLLTAVRSATEAATDPAAALRLELAVSLIRPALTGRMQASSCKPLGYRQG